MNYEYRDDDGGKLKKVIEPGIGETLHEYGAGHGLLTKLTNPHGEITEYGYDAGLRPLSTTFGSGATETFGYDDRGRMNAVVLKNSAESELRRLEYAFDPAGRMTSSTVDGSVVTAFTHDAIGQLLTESRTGYSAVYTYDDNGNRLTRTVGGVTETYVTNPRDELVSISVGGNPVREYTLDLAGRTTGVTVPGAGTTTFAYDFEDRVTSVTYPGASSNLFSYNGLDTRVSATGSFGSRTYRRAGAGVTAPVLGDGVSHFTPGTSVRTGSETRYQHYGLKNIEAQSSSSQTISATRSYDAFGQTLGSSGTWSGPFAYGGAFGYQSEPDSGLQLLGHRYYDPSAGRFLSRDKARYGGNWYAYCGNSPLTNADPTGNAVLAVCGLMLLVVIAASNGAEEIRRDPFNPVAYVVPFLELFGGLLVGKALGKLGGLLWRLRQGALPIRTVAAKKVPNPYGRSGSPGHASAVDDVVQSGKAQGWTHVAGGPLPERMVPGTKRAPDVWFKDQNGNNVLFEIGVGRKDGSPISREFNKLGDLVNHGEVNFVPYK